MHPDQGKDENENKKDVDTQLESGQHNKETQGNKYSEKGTGGDKGKENKPEQQNPNKKKEKAIDRRNTTPNSITFTMFKPIGSTKPL
jgi:hypothetical protein